MKLAAFVLGSIPLIIQFYANKYLQEDLAKTLTELESDIGVPLINTYDFIVVGGGTGGCIVASRLSEKFKVLLLENGGDPVPQSQVPYYVGYVATDPDTNYKYSSIPQPNADQQNGGIVTIHTGKMLGGSGSHNDMVHNRGNPLDYDNIAKITGDDSWTYANVLQYFKKSETFIGQLFNEGEEDLYGKDGPLTVDADIKAILPKWFEAGAQLGFKSSDPNGYQSESFAPLHKLQDKGQRVSTYNRYIKPIEATRQNLTVIRYAFATQLLIDTKNINKKVYGVAYTRHGIPQIAHASKEIIVSTGALSSPLLLMRSGIGPKEILDEAGIPVVVNSQGVGKNLADHVYVMINDISFNASAWPYLSKVPEDEFETVLENYHATGSGFLGEMQEGPQAILISSRAKASSGESLWPDMTTIIDMSCPTAFQDDQTPSACMWGELTRARSRGSITLNTTAYKAGVMDDTKLAVIDFNMLGDPSDADVLIESIQLGLKVMEETNAFKSLGAKYEATPSPECQQYVFRSQEYWRCYVKHFATSAIHMVGTCSMGSGLLAVTDSKLKVLGVTGLRVVDASVLPATPNANLNAPVILVAEKASDEILKSW